MTEGSGFRPPAPASSNHDLLEGVAYAREGDLAAARDVFRRCMHRDPYSDMAWVWLAWVAESPSQSLEYLREARALLPDSGLIAEAFGWAEQRVSQDSSSASAGEGQAAIADAVRSARRQGSEATSRLMLILGQAGERLRIWARWLREAVAGWHLPALKLDWSSAAISAIALVCIAALVFVVYFVMGKVRDRGSVVQALELPTPVADATATPTAEQRLRPLWIKADVAWTRQDWDQVIVLLDQVREIDPRNEEARARLAEAYHNRALLAIEEDALTDAKHDLDTAVRLDAGSEHLQATRLALERYRDGLAAYRAQDWDGAISILRIVYEKTPYFRDTQEMLAEAYFRRGQERGIEAEQLPVTEKIELLEAGKADVETALQLRPDWPEAKNLHQEISDLILPPRRIEVDLSDKLTTVYQDNQPIKVFEVCTGRPSHPTAPGRYEVQTKMEEAYGSTWDLWMPKWLGIYDAGGTENGFHALPILSSGQTLWRGSLGTGCSYGCIVLDTPDAEWLYDWADLGTAVIITR